MLYVVWTSRGPHLVTMELDKAVDEARATKGSVVSKFTLGEPKGADVSVMYRHQIDGTEQWLEELSKRSYESRRKAA